jgi:hypothetical protein
VKVSLGVVEQEDPLDVLLWPSLTLEILGAL